MSLDATLLRKALRMFASKSVSQEDAEELAVVLDSREEMLAYLVLRTDFLKVHPDVGKAILQAAKEGGYEAVTVRRSDGPIAATRRAGADMENCVAALISAERKLLNTLSTLSSIDEVIVKYASTDLKHISPERWIKT